MGGGGVSPLALLAHELEPKRKVSEVGKLRESVRSLVKSLVKLVNCAGCVLNASNALTISTTSTTSTTGNWQAIDAIDSIRISNYLSSELQPVNIFPM